MYLIVGLGNPGKKYERTRHNAGFDAIEILANRLSIKVSKLRCKALTGEGFVGGEKLVLAMPQTYMNLSGEAVSALMHYFDVPPERLIVIYDDIDLDVGRLRVRGKGSAGTHNGMKSIIYHLETDEFPRVRVGVGKPQNERMDLADFVLSNYAKDEREAMFGALERAGDAALCIIQNGVDEAMARNNGK